MLNIVYHIAASEHHDTGELYVIRDTDGSGAERTTVVKYADLSAAEKTEYDDLKDLCNAYLPTGKTVAMITIQIDQKEHNSQERVVICYDDGGEPVGFPKNYVDLTSGEQTKYNDFKTQASGKVPA